MPSPKPTSLSSLTVADLKALLAEKEIEVLKERQAELGADLRRVEKELARLVKDVCKRRSKSAAPAAPVQKCGTPCRRREMGQISQGIRPDGSGLRLLEARRCTQLWNNGPRSDAVSCRRA